jgi:hypothetical protein
MKETMNETEDQVVDILTSYPPTDRPWGEPVDAVMRAMKWDNSKTRKFIEYLMHRQFVVLKGDVADSAPQRIRKDESWWEVGDGI